MLDKRPKPDMRMIADRAKALARIDALLMLALAMIVMMVPFAAGLGISPGKRTIDFTANSSINITLKIFNNEEEDFTASITKEGDLADMINLHNTSVLFTSDEDMKEISYSIDMPQIMQPGTHAGEITCTAIAEDTEVINVIRAVKSLVEVFVPYPGLFASAILKTEDIKPGEYAVFYIYIHNQGTYDIDSAWAQISVLDPKGESVGEITTESISIRSTQKKELVSILSSDGLLSGDYYVNAAVHYDTRTISLDGAFVIDEFLVKVLDNETEYSSGVAKLTLAVKNIGNRKVEDFYSVIELESGQRGESQRLDLEPGQAAESVLYLENIEHGQYPAVLTLFYEDKRQDTNMTLDISEKTKRLELTAMTGSFWLDAVIILLILLLLIVMAVLIRRAVSNPSNPQKKKRK